MRVWLLGGFRVSVGARTIGDEKWRRRKAASLVKLLALAPGYRLHREQVMDLLWPHLGKGAASNNLHQILHAARRTLEPSAPPSSSVAASSSSYLLLRDEQLTLCPDSPLWVDVEAFEEATVTARHAMEPAAFRAAIDLYAGELLPEDRYEPWVEQGRAQLKELYLSLLLELAALYEEREEFGEAIEALGRAVAQEPTHEGAHLELMRLHALSGKQKEALGQYERLREALYKEFGREPDAATTRLHQEIWTGTFPHLSDSPPAGIASEEEAPSPAGATRHNLPLARTSFIGRERETLELKRLLAMTRLLTLTGAGGCGKTRLALKVASDLAGAYPEGVWLVDLAPLSEAELVLQAVAQALGVREQPGRALLETLKDTLRTKMTLLVVDNCEHLMEAVVGLVDALLDSCPKLRVLATSRQMLNVPSEVNWTVPSLTVPGSRQEAYTPGELEAYESVRLFVDRANQRDPSFESTSSNVQAVAQVCRRLDGIPLAIELAAGRMGMLSAEQLASRLEDFLKLLTGGRSSPATEPCGLRLRGATSFLASPSGCSSGGFRCSTGDGLWRQQKMCAGVRASSRVTSWRCSLSWWRGRWWWPGRGKKGCRASGCWSLCVSMGVSALRRAGKPRPQSARTRGTSCPSPKKLNRSCSGHGRRSGTTASKESTTTSGLPSPGHSRVQTPSWD
jgi:DNA-binding SARP family transcriptional activator